MDRYTFNLIQYRKYLVKELTSYSKTKQTAVQCGPAFEDEEDKVKQQVSTLEKCLAEFDRQFPEFTPLSQTSPLCNEKTSRLYEDEANLGIFDEPPTQEMLDELRSP